jgi:D-glucosaminate-6-phosphate ammonia-lyase
MRTLSSIINAAGKLTALGGSAQHESVAKAQADTAMRHVDLAEQRMLIASKIARIAGAEAACITSGAAAGITMSTAAILTGDNLDLIQQLPQTRVNNLIAIQAGHLINFGAPVEQMIRMGGGQPHTIGSTNNVGEALLRATVAEQNFAAMLYVKSHHCVQTNQVSLPKCIEICHQHQVPVVVDAAAEEDLTYYIKTGADLVIYSGGKAFCGPTSGFIVGKAELIRACELQFQGIARTMKVGKETIAGLSVALDNYVEEDEADRLNLYSTLNDQLLHQLDTCQYLHFQLKPDEANRPFNRVAVSFKQNHNSNIRQLVEFLLTADPSIRTRNHHLDEGFLLLDPRELNAHQVDIIAARLLAFDKLNR